MITLDYGGRGVWRIINIAKFFKKNYHFNPEFDQFRNDKSLFSTQCLIYYDI